MGGSTHSMNPAQVDYSAAMMAQSSNQMTSQLAQVGAQIIGMELMAGNQHAQIAANTEVALENIDAKEQIASMQFHMMGKAESNRHDEAMETIDLRKAELKQGAKIDTSEFSA